MAPRVVQGYVWKNVGAERKNRGALGDIGNVVTVGGVEGKQLPQVSRPVTRSFVLSYWLMNRLQQLKTTRLQMPMADGAQKKAAATTKPKPEEITEVAELKEKAGEKSSLMLLM
ncbi:G2/mitotic-specific cyclin-2-like [Sesamum indicum]|uniref:G2/mitotic-specific cyclin-2-like n=1 Tax=Sesamum indicum TaxID=4182 RepID=A0A8M8V2X4_SESIN|nr:G2/mitotic-specific cyclin-2-like [Sesamum indicum]